MATTTSTNDAWPALPLAAWSDTYATLHLYLQIVGKVRLALSPWVNHSWHVALHLSARGLTTSVIPYGNRVFEIELDFIDHTLSITTADGMRGGFALEAQPVATFYARLMEELRKLGLTVMIRLMPNEIPDAIPFDQDRTHATYDGEYVNRFWRALVQSHRVFTLFRARFIGKCSPVHFFWGAPDLAGPRFSGRTAPAHPGGVPNLPDRVAREAYSHEVSSCGFWPGGGPVPHAAFYSYAYPEPPGFASASVAPEGAFYSTALHEFLLPYDRVRRSATPEATLMEFLQSTYDAAADLGGWDRKALERRRDGEPAGNATGNSR